jgi:nucleoid DNA-binding protein
VATISISEIVKKHGGGDSMTNHVVAGYAPDVIACVVKELKERGGKTVVLPGLGTFKVVKKKARNYRHPGTGKIERSKPKTTILFRPSSKIFA